MVVTRRDSSLNPQLKLVMGGQSARALRLSLSNQEFDELSRRHQQYTQKGDRAILELSFSMEEMKNFVTLNFDESDALCLRPHQATCSPGQGSAATPTAYGRKYWTDHPRNGTKPCFQCRSGVTCP